MKKVVFFWPKDAPGFIEGGVIHMGSDYHRNSHVLGAAGIDIFSVYQGLI